MKKNKSNTLPIAQQNELLQILQARFQKNIPRHPNLQWTDVLEKLENNPSKLWSLYQMEQSGGEPDVILVDTATTAFVFCDCSAESPKERRSVCYDDEALAARKENKPKASAVALAEEMGIELTTEAEYRHLQTLGAFDTKTSSWVKTPAHIRAKGGAIFCDRRYDHVFVYHNGAESYYAGRGFRGILKL